MNMNRNIEAGSGRDLSPKMNFGGRCVASCRKLLAQIENVKAQVVAEFRGRLDEHQRLLNLALNEAEALAWQTGFPHLIFPTLATEKARAVTGWHLRQQSLRQRAPRLLAAA
jgi:cation diffusion facilitator CzcD-associated flavoprotein CzcO